MLRLRLIPTQTIRHSLPALRLLRKPLILIWQNTVEPEIPGKKPLKTEVLKQPHMIMRYSAKMPGYFHLRFPMSLHATDCGALNLRIKATMETSPPKIIRDVWGDKNAILATVIPYKNGGDQSGEAYILTAYRERLP
jgi:hypothetical protein